MFSKKKGASAEADKSEEDETNSKIFLAVLTGAIAKNGLTNSQGEYSVGLVGQSLEFIKLMRGE